MTKKRSSVFFQEKIGATPSVAAPGDVNPSNAVALFWQSQCICTSKATLTNSPPVHREVAITWHQCGKEFPYACEYFTANFLAYSPQNARWAVLQTDACVLGRLATDGFDYVIVGVERKLRHDDERAGARVGTSAAATRLRSSTLSRTTERRRQATPRAVPPGQVPRRARTRSAFPGGKEDSLPSGTQYRKRINPLMNMLSEENVTRTYSQACI